MSDAPHAPRRSAKPSESRRGGRPWADVVVPVLLVVLLAGLGAVLWSGKSRGGFTRDVPPMERRRLECTDGLRALAAEWKSAGTLRATDVCPGPEAEPYSLRDLAAFPVDTSRAAEEPLAACLGLRAAAGAGAGAGAGPSRWSAPHGDVVLIVFADGEVRRFSWRDLGRTPDAAPVVGPHSSSPLLRPLSR